MRLPCTIGTYRYPSRVNDAPWNTFAEGETREITFETGKFELSGSENYVVAIYGNRGMLGSEGMPIVQMQELCRTTGVKLIGPAIPPKVKVTSKMILASQKNNEVPRNDIRLKACVDNEGGEWTGSLRAMVRQEVDWDDVIIGYIDFKPVTIKGDTYDQWIDLVSVDELPAECETGEEYEIALLSIGTDTDEIMSRTKYAKINFTVGDAIDKSVKLSLTDATEVPESVEAGQEATFVFGLKNDGTYFNGEISLDIMSGETKAYETTPVNVILDSKEETTVSWAEKLDLADSDDYILRLTAFDGTEIATRPLVVIGPTKLEMTEATAIPQTVDPTKEETFIFGVRNLGAAFDGKFYFEILDKDASVFESRQIHAAIGRKEETVVRWAEKLDIADNDSYTLRFLTDAGTELAAFPLAVQAPQAAITTIFDNAHSGVRYFNLQGQEIVSPAQGQAVIMVVGANAYKIIFK